MANLTPTFATPVSPKNLSGRYVASSNTAQCRKPWDPLYAGTPIAARQLVWGGTTISIGSTIDCVGLGMSEGQFVSLWQQGYIDWQ